MTRDEGPRQKTPNAHELREHLAYEVHYLVLAAVRFPNVKGREATIYQDSALLHARTLLEFTQPKKPDGWWIADVGGSPPQRDTLSERWVNFINTYAAHIGQRRLKDSTWPVPKNSRRLLSLSKFTLERIQWYLPMGSSDARVEVMVQLTNLGLQYLDNPVESTLVEIARLVDEPSSKAIP